MGRLSVYAGNEHDLFFAQGYNWPDTAVFQSARWRRQATGTMAEIAGRKELKRDIGNRLFLYRGDLRRSSIGTTRAACQSSKPSWRASCLYRRAAPKSLFPHAEIRHCSDCKPGDWIPAVRL